MKREALIHCKSSTTKLSFECRFYIIIGQQRLSKSGKHADFVVASYEQMKNLRNKQMYDKKKLTYGSLHAIN